MGVPVASGWFATRTPHGEVRACGVRVVRPPNEIKESTAHLALNVTPPYLSRSQRLGAVYRLFSRLAQANDIIRGSKLPVRAAPAPSLRPPRLACSGARAYASM